MIRNIFKILWNDRSRYTGILIEQILVFIVLMVSLVSLFVAVKQYREPGLVSADSRVMFSCLLHQRGIGMSGEQREKVSKGMDAIVESLRSVSYVEAITESVMMVPYMRTDKDYHMIGDTIREGDKRVWTLFKASDAEARKVFEPQLREGKWISDRMLEDGSAQAVVTCQLGEQLEWESAVGRKIRMKGINFTIVGVLEGWKHHVFSESCPVLIAPISCCEDYLDNIYQEYCVKIKPGYQYDFFGLLNKEFQRLGLDKSASLMFDEMAGMEKDSMSEMVSSIVMQMIPTIFLVFFAFIGTFGLCWLTAKKRRKEFALRLVMGSTRKKLIRYVVSESLLISVLAALPGILLACLVYDGNMVQVFAIGVTFVLMVLFSAFSAWYPAFQVSKMNPIDVLREE